MPPVDFYGRVVLLHILFLTRGPLMPAHPTAWGTAVNLYPQLKPRSAWDFWVREVEPPFTDGIEQDVLLRRVTRGDKIVVQQLLGFGLRRLGLAQCFLAGMRSSGWMLAKGESDPSTSILDGRAERRDGIDHRREWIEPRC